MSVYAYSILAVAWLLWVLPFFLVKINRDVFGNISVSARTDSGKPKPQIIKPLPEGVRVTLTDEIRSR